MLKGTIIKLIEFAIKKYFLIALRLYILHLRLKYKRKITNNKVAISVVNTYDQSGGAAKIAFSLSSSLKDNFVVNLFVLEIYHSLFYNVKIF